MASIKGEFVMLEKKKIKNFWERIWEEAWGTKRKIKK